MASSTDAVRGSYDSMAPVYDRFTAHHDYDAWTASLEAFAIGHGLRGTRLLDAGCGTGKSFLPFLARGYAVTAFDVSPAMAAAAAAKAPAARVHVHDLRTVPVLGAFDLVCCLDDCLNHLLEPRELTEAFRRLAANLAPGGVLVFDVNTLATYRTFFAELSVDQSPALVLVWNGETPPGMPPSSTATDSFVAYSAAEDGRWHATTLTHRQRHYGRAEVGAALAAAGLEAVAVRGQGLDGAAVPELDELVHTKAVYIARHAR